jgi:DNA-binding response OmpR family regulator
MGMSDEQSTLLVVEDVPKTRAFLADNLTQDGFSVSTARCVEEGVRAVATDFPDLVILDVTLPDGSGLELLRTVRDTDEVAARVDPRTPMLVLSGRAGELDRLRAFERGADDYLVKPFSYRELLARIRAILGRAQERPARGRQRIGALELDPVSRVVSLDGVVVELSQKEFSLLRTLASDPTKVWSKDELMRLVWGHRNLGTTRTLDSHACRLRQKLRANGDLFVINVWGVGYRLVDGFPT